MGDGDGEREGEELKVKDKRRFTADGDSRRPDEESDEKWAEVKGGEAQPAGEGAAGKGQLPPIDFATFILSLATSAQMHMGLIANPQTGRQEKNLRAAKETIDLLEILKGKTKGNLTQDEERLFEHVLYELRMTYVERNKQGENETKGDVTS